MNEDVPSGEKEYAEVMLAHVICTYHREGTVYEKIELLRPLLSNNYHIIKLFNKITHSNQQYMQTFS